MLIKRTLVFSVIQNKYRKYNYGYVLIKYFAPSKIRKDHAGTLHSEQLVTGKSSGQVLPLLLNDSSDYCAISCNSG